MNHGLYSANRFILNQVIVYDNISLDEGELVAK